MVPANLNDQALRRLLGAVGEHLAADGESASIVVVGGAALCLRGWVARTTQDVDVIAMLGKNDAHWLPPDFSAALAAAVARVARDFNVDDDWLNAVVGCQWMTGLPQAIQEDIEWITFHGLRVGLAGRSALIILKLFAAVDHDIRSVHVQDPLALSPTVAELDLARDWVVTQDISPTFPVLLDEVIGHVRSRR